MRDYHIREELSRRVRAMHASEPNTRFFFEMAINRGSSRIDLAVLNGKLCGYEIKSDADTLGRLAAQAAAYNLVFDEITIVVGGRHLAKAESTIPPWWGILKAEECSGRLGLSDIRSAQKNPLQSACGLATLLWKHEAVELLQQHSVLTRAAGKNRDFLAREIAEKLNFTTVANFTREALKARVGWRVDEQPT